MANYDRGVYEPSDEVRVFDGSEEEEDVEGSRLPLLIVLALLVLAMFGGVVWLAYTQGVARGRGETPILAAASGPERVAPPQGGGGGNTVPYQGFKIYEQPAPPDDSADAPAVKPAAAPAAAAPKPGAPPAAKLAAAPPVAKPAPGPKPAPAASPPAASPKSVAALIQQANSTPVTAKPAPAPKQAPLPPGGPATAAPRQLGAQTGAPASVPIAAKPTGGYVLQIGAYKSQADADAAWKAYKAKHAALLSAYSDDVQQADLGDKGTWYRLRISGFADRDMATSLCDRLKADGGACILGR